MSAATLGRRAWKRGVVATTPCRRAGKRLDTARLLQLNYLVFEMPLALSRLGVLVLAKNIFIELHVRSAKVCEPHFDSLAIFQHLLGDVVRVDIDADCAHDAEFLSFNRDRRAFEFSGADVELVVQFVLVEQLPTFEINLQIGGAIAQMPPGYIIF